MLLALLTHTALAGDAAIQPVAEAGTALIALNVLQQGQNGTRIDLTDEGGQGRLLPSLRFRLDVPHGREDRSRFSLTWQPLEVATRAVPPRDWQVRQLIFPSGEPVDVKYGFSFFRASWQRDLLADEDRTFALGANLQLRTSSQEFIAVSGDQGFSEQEFGPVPSIIIRARRDWPGVWTELEIDALPIPDFSGFFGFYEVDARVGLFDARGFEPYIALRGLGGGFAGTSDDGFVDNQLLLFAVLVGVAVR
ncbi:MAG: hypothetical protein AAFV53_03795 [Myxococcota bacterium]